MNHQYTQELRNRIAVPNRVMAPFWYYGGKGIAAKWIVKHLPSHKIYVEPFCGAASVFWHKPQSQVEVLNDLNGDVINLFRVLQDPEKFQEFAHRISWTLYSYDEFKKARRILQEDVTPIDRAWAFFVTQSQGFGGKANSDGDWGRAFMSTRGMAHTSNHWRGRIRLLDVWHNRLTKVQLDHRDALDVITYWDSPETLFYLDPPYMSSTRVDKKVYTHEMTDSQYRDLIDLLKTIEGNCVLSGYDDSMYDELGWFRTERHTTCYVMGKTRGNDLRGKRAPSKASRTEVLWIKSPMQPRLC